jgi:hypothetical protein
VIDDRNADVPGFTIFVGMHLLKQFGAVILVACLVLPFAGTWTWLQYERTQVRKVVKKQIIAGMNRDDLQLFEFSHDDAARLDWHHSEEFGYGGEMYDIVYRETCVDFVLFWCWHDIKETKIMDQVDLVTQNFGHSTPDSNAPGQHFLNFIKTVFLQMPEHPSHDISVVFARMESGAHSYRSVPGAAPPTPPPNIV